jgi:hypothetical protein
MHYIRNKNRPNCPIAGISLLSAQSLLLSFHKMLTEISSVQLACPIILQTSKVFCDPLLRIEIEEFRSSEPVAANATNVEDVTDLNEDDDENDESGASS